MYAKLINNKLTYAPRNYNTGDNLILNFDKNINLMKKHGFKEVIDNKPNYDSFTHYLSVDSYTESNVITINYKLNEIVVDNTPTLEERVTELERLTQEQDELINISLCATDEMYMMIEPLLANTYNIGGNNKMVEMYVAMVQRGLKKIEEVPVRYREQVAELLRQLED